MALDYVKLTDEIIAKVGGVKNITSATNCMTRLRLTLADEGKADDEAVKAIKGVKGVMKQGGQYQIIIGNEVSNLFKEFKTRGNWGDAAQAPAGKPQGNVISRLFGFVAGCMTPLLPAMLGTGMLKVILTLATTFFGMSTEGPTYIILYAVADCFFFFLPIFLAYNIAKKLGGNPMLYAVIGAAMCYPQLITLLAEGATGTFLGMSCTYLFGVIPVVGVTYTSSVLPILLMAPVMKLVETFADKVSPNVLKAFLKPLIFLLICTPIAFCVLGPIGSIIGNFLSMGINAMYTAVPWLTVAILSAVMPLLVMTGMHYALIPLFMNNLATLGFDVVVLVTMFCSNIAQGAATFGVAAKTKNTEIRSEGIACGISAVVAGVTEPALYGINLRFMKPLFAAMAGAGIGGLFCGLTAVRGYTMGGSPSILSLITFIGGDDPMHGVIFGAIAAGIVIVATFILSFIMYKDEEPAEEETPAIAAAPTEPFDICAPIAGVAKPLSECPDEVFSAGTLGDGVMIVPSEGKVFAPCDGKISTLFDTLHAIGITSEDGAELLIHVGMDTVKLKGQGFTAHCKTDDQVKKGDLLLEFDIEYIKSQGLPITTPFVVANSADYAGVKTHLGMMNPGDKILTVKRVPDAAEENVAAENIQAPITGVVQPLSECPDKLFSSGQMGQGFVLEPEEGKVFAPCDGTIKDMFQTLHALGITSDKGAEVLLHIGMNTVDLNAVGFTAHCKSGDKVKAGDLLVEFDIPYIKSKDLPVTTPVIITNGDAYSLLMLKKMGSVTHGDDVLELKA